MVTDMEVSYNTDRADTIAWRGSLSDGVCFMKYVYEVNGVATHKNHALFMEMRKWKDPEYAKGFLWKISQECILTNFRRMLFGLSPSNLCPICDDYEEPFREKIYQKKKNYFIINST